MFKVTLSKVYSPTAEPTRAKMLQLQHRCNGVKQDNIVWNSTVYLQCMSEHLPAHRDTEARNANMINVIFFMKLVLVKIKSL